VFIFWFDGQDEVEFDQDNSGWTGPDENEIDDEPAPIKQSKDKKSLAAVCDCVH
jgi:hypothetical protein